MMSSPCPLTTAWKVQGAFSGPPATLGLSEASLSVGELAAVTSRSSQQVFLCHLGFSEGEAGGSPQQVLLPASQDMWEATQLPNAPVCC